MIAIELLYELVKTAIVGDVNDATKNGVPIIRHFDWWNGNVVGDGRHTPYPTPAVFFDLNFIEWEQSTKGGIKNKSSLLPEQQGYGEFTLHIIHKKIDSSAVDASEVAHMQEMAEVFKAVHFLGGDKPFLQGAIQRVRDNGILIHNVLRDWSLSFGFSIFECAFEDTELEEVFPWQPDVDIDAEAPYLRPILEDSGATLASSAEPASSGNLISF